MGGWVNVDVDVCVYVPSGWCVISPPSLPPSLTHTRTRVSTHVTSPTQAALLLSSSGPAVDRAVVEKQLAILDDALKPEHAGGDWGLERLRLRCVCVCTGVCTCVRMCVCVCVRWVG